MQKNTLLKVSSILLIIGGAFLALMAIIFFAAGDAVAKIVGGAMEGADAGVAEAAVRAMVIIMAIIFLVEAAAYIAAGVIGVKQKSVQACFIVAIILVVVCGIGVITNLVQGQFTSIISLIVPVLYLVGAIQLRKDAKQAAEEETVSQIEE